MLAATSKNLTVTGCATHALSTRISAGPGLPKGGKFTGNGQDRILLPGLNGTDDPPTGTIPNLGVPYYVTGVLNIGGGGDVTIEPGTEFMFISGVPAGMNVGWNGNKTKLVAQGTAAAPIIFRGEKDGLGTWTGVEFGGAASTESKLDHVDFRNAGVKTDAAITITNSSFSPSADFAILKQEDNPTDYAATNTFSGNAKGNVGMK
ncbi:MAG TPA: hypothetical protein VJV78_12455 [Polyangiales bacterium]|nr:hypothetical protein [Polyangiales bacterium]